MAEAPQYHDGAGSEDETETPRQEENPIADEDDSDSTTGDVSILTRNLSSTSLHNVEFSVKHPLQNRWTWWYDCSAGSSTSRSWTNKLCPVYTVDTVEDFWSLFRSIKPASTIPKGANYRLFKEGIQPAWEDPKNARGGAWIIKVSNKAGANKGGTPGAANKTAEWLDQSWMYLLLECIGEAFGDDSDEICGAVASVRSAESRLALWTRTAADSDAVQRIGDKFKEIINLQPPLRMSYVPHEEPPAPRGGRGGKH